MQWVTIDRLHLNTDRVESFHWIEGRLFVRYPGTSTSTFRDPEKKKYLKLCAQLGVKPVEDDQDGEG